MTAILVAGCGARATPPAANPPAANAPTAAAPAWSCPAAPHVTIDPRPAWPDICRWDDQSEKCGTLWRGDLDGDGHEDRIVRIEDACGTGGCELGVLAACPDGSYAQLWFDYAVTFDIGEPDGAWRTIVLHEDADTPELRSTTTRTLHFDGTAYR
jgi:hypothetical protein